MKKIYLGILIIFSFFYGCKQPEIVQPVEDTIFKVTLDACASAVVSSNQGLRKNGSAVLPERSDPNYALNLDANFFSLGFGGEIIVAFDNFYNSGRLVIHEQTNGSYPLERAKVYVSEDGTGWTYLGEATNTNGTASTRASYFNLGTACIKYVKIVDETNPALHNNEADGFDVNSICLEETEACVSCEPFTTSLFAGAGKNDTTKGSNVGNVTITNDENNLFVTYNITASGWTLTEFHVYAGINNQSTSAPGQFPYSGELGAGVTSYTLTIPLASIGVNCADNIKVATHAVVKKESTFCIDFEEFNEKDFVQSINTSAGDVSFYMVSSSNLNSLNIGGAASLTPISGSFPQIAAPDTKPSLDNIVAFTVDDTRFGGTDNIRDDYIRDANNTGAFNKTLTDPQDLSQTPLLQHAYSQGQAMVIDFTALGAVQAVSFAAIDLDHNENWTFQFFNSNNELLYQTVYNESALGLSPFQGDGKAFPVNYSDPNLAKVVIWGGDNLGISERVGYAIDNLCVTLLNGSSETAWGYGNYNFIESNISKKWGWFFDYFICCD